MQLFALSADGMASLVCRYLAPVPIPPPLEQQIQALREAGGGLLGAMAVASRFASLVPVLDSGWVLPGAAIASLLLHQRAQIHAPGDSAGWLLAEASIVAWLRSLPGRFSSCWGNLCCAAGCVFVRGGCDDHRRRVAFSFHARRHLHLAAALNVVAQMARGALGTRC
jgi:hypothetical protein